MESAKFDRNTITIIASEDKMKLSLKQPVQLIKFDGFLKIIKDSIKVMIMMKIYCLKCTKGPSKYRGTFLDEQHFTQPPPRYSEASLVKKLEELGIGRPSTYASIISVISTRGYAETIKQTISPYR